MNSDTLSCVTCRLQKVTRWVTWLMVDCMQRGQAAMREMPGFKIRMHVAGRSSC